MRLAIIGRTRMLLTSAERLAAAGHRVVAVIACTPAPDYGGTADDFQRLAATHSAPYLFTDSLNTAGVAQLLRDARPDVAASAGWPTRIDARTRDLFPFGILNIHGGDLPRYRGNAPFAWALLNGEPFVGITVHQMDDGLDSGPVLVKAHIPLTTDTYIGDLYAALDREGPSLFVQAINGLADGSLTPCPQQGIPLVGYSRRPEDGAIQWQKAATHIARLVRASSEPLAGAFATFNGQRLTVWRARAVPVAGLDPVPRYLAVPGQVISRTDTDVTVACGSGEVIVETVGADRQPAATVIRSLRDRLHDG